MGERSGRHHNTDEDRYGAGHRRRDDSHDNDRGKEVARRSEHKKSSRQKSESDESEDDSRSNRKSKSDSRALVKSDSKSKDKKKKRRQKDSDDGDDSDNEVITTKRKRFEEVSFEDLVPEYIDAMVEILEIKESKIDKACHDRLIRLDTVEDCMNADKAVERHGDGKAAEEEWARFEKRYKRDIKARGGEKLRLGRGGESAGPSGHRAAHVRESPIVVVHDTRPPVLLEQRPRLRRVDTYGEPIFEHRVLGCIDCDWMGRYCGNPYHQMR